MTLGGLIKRRTIVTAATCGIGLNIVAASFAPAAEAWVGQGAPAKSAPQALFAGYDVNGYPNLWITDGTSSGTRELEVSGGETNGLFAEVANPDFTVLNGKVVFAGYDATARNDLWVTDGTSAGTTPLARNVSPSNITVLGAKAVFAGGPSLFVTDGTVAGTKEVTVSGAYSSGIFDLGSVSPDFTVLGSKVLFLGADASYQWNLWVTDGTAAGTRELQALGEYQAGLVAQDITVLGNTALLAGRSASGGNNLWITDGTAAGTTQLNVADAFSDGLLETYPDFVVLGGNALFNGVDGSGRRELWTTNGTSAGTSELDVTDANSEGLMPAEDGDLAVSGSKVLFEGFDAAGSLNPWITDGTSAGTQELTAPGADQSGLFCSCGGASFSAAFTVLGKTALFAGRDAGGNVNLWVTDGTSAGTSQLKVAGAYRKGLNPQNFYVLGNHVLFNGRDESGNPQLWTTDGTSSGTLELQAKDASAAGLNPYAITALPTPQAVRKAFRMSAPD
jgi:ELWxxDGT repeat protein